MTTPEKKDTTAPERIWLQVAEERNNYRDAYDSGDDVYWQNHSNHEKDVEYVRADLVENVMTVKEAALVVDPDRDVIDGTWTYVSAMMRYEPNGVLRFHHVRVIQVPESASAYNRVRTPIVEDGLPVFYNELDMGQMTDLNPSQEILRLCNLARLNHERPDTAHTGGRMSLDIYLIDGTTQTDCLYCHQLYEEDNEVYSSNITHNLAEMARAVGVYDCLWRPEENGITKAGHMTDALTRAKELLKDPSYDKYNAENGWGTRVDFLRFVEGVYIACKLYPEATVRASR